ncbi:3'(2'),5'-bisphosphate nucleotidase CysQ [Shewanella putrefaciens]|uniref:3'(2'),5'-bisphosphate nucleotidase CysQ n=1 Tax=Shewanella putrefaciens TaxID=24 RepID=UPI00242B88D7|nr:3'(2'),5'-bisphosphate nucleotidase CysQ [Shewanella putrefaciens]MCA1896273.1 3'(2'),5'-bisphosphate nucleotidase CysQ [Shewanella putrefaciens]
MIDKRAIALTLTKQDLLEVVNIAKVAGDAIMAIYEQDDVVVSHKGDDSPITMADVAAHHIIVQALTARFAGIPVMSEEASDIPWEERRQWQCYWLIDPLDGTKEFIKRNGEFTVNIALINQGIAIAGVVYAPVFNTFYYGAKHLGAWRQKKDVEEPLAGVTCQRDVPIIVGSRSHLSPDLAEYLARLGEHKMLSVGSSLKFCLLAQGDADLYPRLGPTSEWDTAAAQAVLESAGGKVVRYGSDDALTYNQKSEILNPYFIATAPGWVG